MVNRIIMQVAGKSLIYASIGMRVMHKSQNLHLLSTLKCLFELSFVVKVFVPSDDVALEKNVSGSLKPTNKSNHRMTKQIKEEAF